MEMMELSHKVEVPVDRIAAVLQRDAVLAAPGAWARAARSSMPAAPRWRPSRPR